MRGGGEPHHGGEVRPRPTPALQVPNRAWQAGVFVGAAVRRPIIVGPPNAGRDGPSGVDRAAGGKVRQQTSGRQGSALRWLPDEGRGEGRPELPTYHELLPTPHRPSAPDDDRPRVLAADDNADMRQYVARLLAEQFRVEAVPDGEAALAAARERPPDLILTDVMMPRLEGFGLLRELRADPRTGGLPVIMLSARAGEESRVEGMEAGADDYLVKPFRARELLARVPARLQMARLRREANESVALREGVIVGLANHTILIAKDGTERPIDDSAAPIRCEAGEVVGVVLVFRDVTERRRAERERQQGEENFWLMIEQAPDAVFVADSDGRYTDDNDQACELLGFTGEELVGRTTLDLIRPEEAGRLERLRRDQLEGATGRRSGSYAARTAASSPSRSVPASCPTGGGSPSCGTSPTGSGWRASCVRSPPSCRRPTAARTSSWRRWPTNSATRWHRSATASRS